jgi:hypothetical protein
MRAELRLEKLQENNTMTNKMFNRNLSTIDDNVYPAVALNHVECDQNLRVIVGSLVPARGTEPTARGPLPDVPPERQRIIAAMCTQRVLPSSVSHDEANEYLDYTLPDGRWGTIFASADDDMLAEKRRADQMRAMVVDMCVAKVMASKKNTDDVAEQHNTARRIRSTLDASLVTNEPANQSMRYREAWDTAVVMMLLYYRARLDQLIANARQHAMVLYNNAATLGVALLETIVAKRSDGVPHTVAGLMCAYVKSRLLPPETRLVALDRLTIDDTLGIVKSIPAAKSTPIVAGARKRTGSIILPSSKRANLDTDDEMELDMAPTEAELDRAAAAHMRRTTTAVDGKDYYADDDDSRDAPGALDNFAARPPRQFVGFNNLFHK